MPGKAISKRWRDASINTKFILTFGLLLALIILMSGSSFTVFSLFHRQTGSIISTSTQIQHLILKAERNLQESRVLQRDFFQQYPHIGLTRARQSYVNRAIEKMENVAVLSQALRQNVAESEVSTSLEGRDVELNFYFSAAERYQKTFAEAVDMVTLLAAEETGLEAQLARNSSLLYETIEDDRHLLDLYLAMTNSEKDYFITRRRPRLHTALNIAFQLQSSIQESTTLGGRQKEQALIYLDNYGALARQIANLHVAIQDKLNDFDLQAQAVDPISTELLHLAQYEVEQAQTRVDQINLIAGIAFGVTILLGVGLILGIANIFHISTRQVIKLTQAAGELQRGNLSASVQIDSADELGQLAATFNAMAAEIRAKVTEMTQLNQSLQASERKFRRLFQDSPDSIAITTPDGRFVDINAAGERLLGHSRAELMERNVQTFYANPQDREKFRQGVEQDGLVSNFETQFYYADGTMIDVILNATLQRAEDGTITGYQTIVHDITQRKRMEKALRRSNENLAEAQRIARIGSWELDLLGGQVAWSDELYRIMQIDPLVDLDLNEVTSTLIHPDDREKTGQAIQQALLVGDLQPFEFRAIRGDGEELVLWCKGDVIYDEKGKPVTLRGIDQDVTERVRAEEELRLYREHLEELVKERTAELVIAKERAEAANLAKSAFLANMSHELRTPLNAILGFTQLMRRDLAFPQPQQENLRIIHHSGEHLLELINDVLEMSKIEAGRATFTETDFDLHQLLTVLESMFDVRAKNKGLQLAFECAPDVPQYIRTDERKLHQVLINLLGNAIKFTDAGSVTLRINKSTSRQVNEWSRPQTGTCTLEFQVEDTGMGIAPGETARLFEAFTQTASGQEVLEGTGLGLALSRRLVQLMGGDISVESQVGRGSVFRFDVQVAVVEARVVQARQPTRRVVGLASGESSSDGDPYRILVVEDREANRVLLVQLLAATGFQVREAVNGEEAVAVWETWEPHLIWMDMRMPVMDGYEATRRIKASAKGQATVVIALTASAFEADRTAILAVGCDDFVRKPFQEAEIFDGMAEHLGVRYIYEELALSDERDSDSQVQVVLTPADLAVLPPGWIADLRQAAMQGESERLLELVGQIESEYAALARAVAQLVREFRFDRIMVLTDH